MRDEISTLGFGLVQKKAFDLELELGVDYSYSHGRGETDTTQSYSYSDVTSTQHRVEGYALYQLDEKNSLRWDLRYESFENADYLNTDDRQSLGDVDDDYDGYFTSVSWLYKF